MNFDSRVPKFLLELQQWMGAVLVCPLRNQKEYQLPHYEEELIAEIEKRITPGPSLSAAQRMGIYNQQYWFRLLALMQKHYPSLTRLFGYADFNRLLAEPYLVRYFPNHWSLAKLGSRLPVWVREEYQEEDRDLVYQMALIDEAHERLFYAHPLSPLTKEDLSRNRTLFLQPTLALFALEADLFAFRRALLEQEVEYWAENEFPKIDWADGMRFFVLFMNGEELFREEISQKEHLLLKAFEGGAKIEEALSFLQNQKKYAKVREWFQKWGERKWLTHVKPLYISDESRWKS